MRTAFACVRLVASMVCLVTLIARLNLGSGLTGAEVADFFSYFTMLSAISAMVLWAVGGVIGLRRDIDPVWLVNLRVVVTTYQVVSGIVFALITVAASVSSYPMIVPVSSDVLHYWLSAYAIIDWAMAPGQPAPRWRVLRATLPLPAVWTVYTLVRGPIAGWYPYFFLDPALTSVLECSIYLAAAGTLIVAICAGLIAIRRALPRTDPLSGADLRRIGTEPGSRELLPSRRHH